MPKKFPSVNSKVAAANEKKQAVKAVKEAIAAKAKEEKLAEIWEVGAKNSKKKEEKEQKRLEKLALKQQREEIIQQEDSLNTKKTLKTKVLLYAPTSARSEDKKAQSRQDAVEQYVKENAVTVETYSASGIDAALDMLELATKPGISPANSISGDTCDEPTGHGVLKNANMMQSNNRIERHPEKRVKSAFAIFEEKTLPIIRAENPTLRHSQVRERVQRLWKKSPENPLNQAYIDYNTKSNEAQSAIQNANKIKLSQYKS